MSEIRSIAPAVPKQQTDAVTDVTAVQNQWYDAWTGLACVSGAGTKKTNVNLKRVLIAMQTLAEDIAIKIILDGVANDGAKGAAVAGTVYTCHFNVNSMTANIIALEALSSGYVSEVGNFRSVGIEFRKTTANGANKLKTRVVYGLW